MKRKLNKLLKNIDHYRIYGDINLLVSSISDNSLKVKKGTCFVAIKGLTVDAHKYIPNAIKSGASVIVGEQPPKATWLSQATYVRVLNSRDALSKIAAAWYDNPAKKLKVIGVTGTDGKTTTTNLIYWILKSAGKKVGMVSTVNAKIGDRGYDTGFHVTNPEPILLQKLLRKMVERGCEYAVLEVTSHGLSQERVAGILFRASVLTNITHEHLDYHKSFKNYVSAKARLFQNSSLSILNKESSYSGEIARLIKNKKKILYYSVKSLPITVRRAVKYRFAENYNQQNAAAAALAASSLGINEKTIQAAIKTFPGVEGRMQIIGIHNGVKYIVDFAHTPNALENVLVSLKKQLGKGRLISVFGCAGKRDYQKRPMMGKISTRLADISVFTSEDPRTEDIQVILDKMVSGAKQNSSPNQYYTIKDRAEAIRFASGLSRKGDVVVVCGKGHEKSMNIGGVEYPWSDIEFLRDYLDKCHRGI